MPNKDETTSRHAKEHELSSFITIVVTIVNIFSMLSSFLHELNSSHNCGHNSKKKGYN